MKNLEHYVETIPVSERSDRWAVHFTVGNQSFLIADELESLEEAAWWRDQFLTALRAMIREVTV